MSSLAASPTLVESSYPHRWRVAVVMIVAALLDMIDGSIVNTALPAIGRSIHASPAQLEWMVSAYLLGFASSLIVAGHLGDRLGRKTLFVGGVAVFALASLASAVAATGGELVGARAAQGVAAAVIVPQVLGSLRTMFTGAERGKVFAIYGAIAGLAVAAGVLLGGLLTDWDLFGWSWRTIFAVNIPVAGVVLMLGVLWLPNSRESRPGRLNIAASIGLAASLVAVVLPLIEGRSNGWPLWGWLCMSGGALGLILLTVIQAARHNPDPVLAVALLRARAFSVGLMVQMIFFGSMTGFMLAFTIWLQTGQGFTPAHAGVTMLAFSCGTILTAPMVDGLIATAGRLLLVVGGIAMAAGFWWVRQAVSASAESHTSAWRVVPGLLVAGAGLGFLVVPLANIVLSAAPADVAGNASGVFTTAQQFGGALGVAIVGNAFFKNVGDGFTAGMGHAASWSVGGLAACALLCLALPRTAIAEAYADRPAGAVSR